MKQSYINFIEKTVRAKCPELQKLTTGCKYQYWNKILTYSHRNNDFHVFIWEYGGTFWLEIVSIPDIIGHEIHLEHILRTMGTGDKWFCCKASGRTSRETFYIKSENKKVEFDLSLSWKDQDISFLKFCAETLWFNQ